MTAQHDIPARRDMGRRQRWEELARHLLTGYTAAGDSGAMNTTTAPLNIITAPEGTLLAYSYSYRGELVTVTGRKGRAINPGQSAGFEILGEAGEVVGRTSRYTVVTILEEA